MNALRIEVTAAVDEPRGMKYKGAAIKANSDLLAMWNWWRTSQCYCTLCAIAVIVAFLYMAFSIEPAVQPAPLPSSQDQPITTNDQATKHGTSRRDEQETFWRWTTKDATGFYTFLLAAVTGGLALVAALQAGMFFWQLKLMHEGINDAKTAASTAATAAAAATTQAQELRRSADAAGMAGGSYGRSASRSDSMNAFLIGSPAPSCNAVTESYLGLQRSQGDATT